MINGINHITISVRDIDVSFEFYTRVLGFKPLMKHVKGAYLLAGDTWFCLEVTSSMASHEHDSHLAFSVTQENFVSAKDRLQAAGATIWKENKSEGDSVYFQDPDGHKLEIHVGDWRTRIDSYKKRADCSHIKFYV